MMRISPHFSLPVYIGEWPITAYTMQIYCASLRIKTDAKDLYKNSCLCPISLLPK